MIKGLVVIANGFEDTEAITTIDILRRASLNIDLVYLDDKEVVSQNNVKYTCDICISDVSYEDYDFLIIPGGKAVLNVLNKREEINDLILHFYNNKKLIAAICAAPILLGKLNLLEGLKFTCFKGCNNGINGRYTKNPVEVTKSIITAKSIAYSVDFALAIVERLLGKSKRENVENSIYSR